MTPQHWQQVKQIFQSVIECPPGERAAFLARVCHGDRVLRSEVESLISSYDQAGDSIEAMAAEVATEAIADNRASLMIGRQIGHYEVLGHIGRGGMGEVFLAQDTRLGRKVALKLLRSEYTKDEGRLRRFRQEARAVSALNHPNILTIYDIGQTDSLHFMATEYVEGETLRQHTARERLPLGEALDVATQAAGALAAAHKAGIIHRDIKPENIMLRADGYVKVLDFGLAKLAEPKAVDTTAATLPTAETGPGVVMGTVSYMSPEQARGQEMDAQTDIWSLGVVLYEMVAGRQPYEGETASDVVALILQKEPVSLAHCSPGVPAELERIVRKALRKDKEERYQTVKDLLIDLKNLRKELEVEAELERSVPLASSEARSGGRAAAGIAPQTSSAEYIVSEIKHHKRAVAVALALLVAVISAALLLMRQREQLGAPVLTQLTTDTGLTTDPALSPDGKLLAYASDRSGKGNLDIWVRQIGGGEPIRLTQDPADEREPVFSPEGTMIAFRSEREGGGIYVVSALGGPSRKIASEGQRPRFSPDGSQIAYWSGTIGHGAAFSSRNYCRIFVVASTGGVSRQVRPDFVGAAYPEWAPDGKHLLFLGNRDENLPVDENIDWWVTPLDEGLPIATGAFRATRKQGLTGPLLVYPWALISPVWETGGDSLIFSARSGDSRNLWRIGISPQTWKVTGPPQRLTSSPTIEESPSVSSMADGSVKVAFSSLSENTDIWSLPLDGDTGKVTGEPRQLTRDSAADFHPSLSADGRKMVFVSSRSGNQEIWIKDLNTGEDAVLTASRVDKYHPHFSPDATKVSFAAHRENKWDIYLVPATGGAAEMVCEDCGQATGWSPDGRYLIGNSVDGRLYLVDVASHRRIDLVALGGRWFAGGTFSPDGRWITFLETSLPWREHIAPFQGEAPAAESSWISVLGELREWSPGGALVYGPSDHDGFNCIWAQRVDRVTKHPVGSPLPIFHSHAAQLAVFAGVSVGRERMVFTLAERAGNIWMAQWKSGW